MLVTFEGRQYRLVVGESNCSSRGHWHVEPHADGAPGDQRHHHHDARCSDVPRQATLYPAWEVPPSHIHDFGAAGAGQCSCGAARSPVGRLLHITMPADAAHPLGWSYDRKE